MSLVLRLPWLFVAGKAREKDYSESSRCEVISSSGGQVDACLVEVESRQQLNHVNKALGRYVFAFPHVSLVGQ